MGFLEITIILILRVPRFRVSLIPAYIIVVTVTILYTQIETRSVEGYPDTSPSLLWFLLTRERGVSGDQKHQHPRPSVTVRRTIAINQRIEASKQ